MKRLLKVTSFTALLTLLRMASGFIIAKVVAIYTGPSGMAMLGQLQSVVAAINGVISAPVGNGLVRYTAENHEKGYNACMPWWRASIQWACALAFLLISFGCLFSSNISELLLSSPDYSWLITVTVLILPLTVIGTMINSVINGHQHYRRYIGLGMISVLISTLIMVMLIVQMNIEGALLAVSLQYGLIGFVLLLANIRQPWLKLTFWVGKVDKENLYSIAGYIVMAITSAITTPLALILVRNILVSEVGWDQAGQWQAVWKISEVYLGVVTMALSTYYLPKLSKLRCFESIRKEVNKTAAVVLPIVILMALSVYLLRDFAIELLFTEEFQSARELFLVQLIGDVFKILSWLYAFPMISRGATKWYVATELIFSINFVMLCYFLIPEMGTHGANYSYLINYIFSLCFVYLNLKRFAQ